MNDQNGLKILFAGTPDFAAIHLKALLTQTQHQVVGVYTQPDRPAGRGKKLQASPVKQVAVDAGLSIEQPQSLKSEEAQSRLAAYNADLMVVVAYGLLLPKAVLDTPLHGCINVHASILPRWRGAAPIQRAIEAGDTTTGVTIMQMDVGLDTGDMLRKVECPIHPTDSASDLHDRLADLGPPALLSTLDDFVSNQVHPVCQEDTLATYAHKLSKEEAKLDWNLSAGELDRKIRAFNPFPVAHTPFNNGSLRILQAEPLASTTETPAGHIVDIHNDQIVVACGGGGCLALRKIQLPGKKALAVRDVLNGSSQLFSPGNALASQ